MAALPLISIWKPDAWQVKQSASEGSKDLKKSLQVQTWRNAVFSFSSPIIMWLKRYFFIKSNSLLIYNHDMNILWQLFGLCHISRRLSSSHPHPIWKGQPGHLYSHGPVSWILDTLLCYYWFFIRPQGEIIGQNCQCYSIGKCLQFCRTFFCFIA